MKFWSNTQKKSASTETIKFTFNQLKQCLGFGFNVQVFSFYKKTLHEGAEDGEVTAANIITVRATVRQSVTGPAQTQTTIRTYGRFRFTN